MPAGGRTIRTPACPGATTAWVLHPSLCATRSPGVNSGLRDSSTRPTARPYRSGSPISHPASISSRMYGSTDRWTFSTSAVPGARAGSSSSTKRKCSAVGNPSGRAASRTDLVTVLVITHSPGYSERTRQCPRGRDRSRGRDR